MIGFIRELLSSEMWTTWVLIGVSLMMGLGALYAFFWVLRSGQMDSLEKIEEVKYLLFRIEEQEGRADALRRDQEEESNPA